MDATSDTYAEIFLSGGCSPTQKNRINLQQDNPPAGDAEPAFAEPAPPEMSKKVEPHEDDLSSPLDTNKRHSQASEPLKAKLATKEVEVKSWALNFGLTDETDVTRFADHHIADRLDADGEAFTV